MSIREEIIAAKFISDNGRPVISRIRKEFELVSRIVQLFEANTGHPATNVSEALYYFYNELVCQPTCAYCHTYTKYINFTHGYHAHCSSKCAALNPDSQKKVKKTTLIRYGVENASKSREIQQRIKNTMVYRYGVENPMQNTCIKEKAKLTNLERYGSNSPLQNACVKTKTISTNLEKYGSIHPMKSNVVKEQQIKTNMERRGVAYPMQSQDVRRKSKETNNERYGCDNPTQNADIRKKIVETSITKFGVTHPSQNVDVKNKSRQTNIDRYGMEKASCTERVKQKQAETCIKKYGVPATSQRFYSKETRNVLFDKDIFSNFVDNKSMNSAAEELRISTTTISRYFRLYDMDVSASTYEKEIAAFLRDNGIEFEANTQKVISPLELDFYIPKYSLGIEFNGLFWHSDQLKDNHYHLNKLKACNNNRLRLIMINEDEWIKRKFSVQSRILNICQKTERGISARKTNIFKVSNNIADAFVEKYHIQGCYRGATSSFGAYDESQNLVGIMQFAKQRGLEHIELVRFCSDAFTHAGLFSKMFKIAVNIEEYKYVVSFADLRYSEGNVYELNGFKKERMIPPDYRYIKGTDTFHKSTFTKKKIEKRFGLDMMKLTERQAMIQLGYLRIYDCGKLKYTWRKDD